VSNFPRPDQPVAPHSLLATPFTGLPPKTKGTFWQCALIGFGLLLAIAAVAYLGNAKLGKVSRDATKAKDSSDAALSVSNAALKVVTDQRDSEAGLLQSIGQTLSNLKASGLLTPEQLAAIAAGIQATQKAQGGAKAQTGTTPGIPGSRSGGGMSVTPGVAGSAALPVLSAKTTPPPSSSSTARCLATVNIPPIFLLDGTVCP
jgi:hypothetical protein